MLRVELRSLEAEDVLLEETGWAKALGVDLTPELSLDPLEVHCELCKTEDLISAKGWVKGKMLLACGRCLKEFETGYKSFFEIYYRPQREEEPENEEVYSEDAVETVYFEGDILDIAEQIRQTVLLSVPMRALCREDCKGFCGGCGRNLNVEDCKCSGPPPDSRWSSLKNWKPR